MIPKLIRTRAVGEIAVVHLLQIRPSPQDLVECVGALDPQCTPRQKMVLVLSSQLGCPIRCTTCDAGTEFRGNLSRDELLAQARYLLEHWAGPEASRCEKFKIQFARMGEPSLNDAVLEALMELPRLAHLPGLMPCLATMAPAGREPWFERLLEIKESLYPNGAFQLQFSIQTTSDALRDQLIPVSRWTLPQIAAYAARFARPHDRRVVLNFALARSMPLEVNRLAEIFDPRHCIVKLTPLNPTARASASGWASAFQSPEEATVQELVAELRLAGFGCIVSVGLAVETSEAASCGQLSFAETLARSASLRSEISEKAAREVSKPAP